MSPDEAPNPFQRGTGSYPPVLAGRQAELTALHRLLSGLANGTLEQTIHLMQAPRGLGKTVLLQALERDASVRVDAVDVRRTSAGVFTDIDDLAQLIEPARSLPRRLLNWFAGASAFGVRIERPTGGGGKTLRKIERALERRSRRPLLLAVDEAYVLPPPVCRTLLNAFQNATGKARCALLLVGTPALTPLLLSQEVNASFAERAPVIIRHGRGRRSRRASCSRAANCAGDQRMESCDHDAAPESSDGGLGPKRVPGCGSQEMLH